LITVADEFHHGVIPHLYPIVATYSRILDITPLKNLSSRKRFLIAENEQRRTQLIDNFTLIGGGPSHDCGTG